MTTLTALYYTVNNHKLRLAQTWGKMETAMRREKVREYLEKRMCR
jgi:hypothetical protein